MYGHSSNTDVLQEPDAQLAMHKLYTQGPYRKSRPRPSAWPYYIEPMRVFDGAGNMRWGRRLIDHHPRWRASTRDSGWRRTEARKASGQTQLRMMHCIHE